MRNKSRSHDVFIWLYRRFLCMPRYIYQKSSENACGMPNSLNFTLLGVCVRRKSGGVCMNTLKRTVTLYLVALLFSFSFVFLPFSSCEAAQVYQISEEQLTELSMITKRQEERLALLQTKLSVLEMSSTEQEKKLTEVLSQLQKSKNQLAEVQKSLENANVSLEKARLIISEQEKSLTQLEKAVKDLEHRVRLAKRQRNVWAALSGGLLLYGIAK